MEAQLQKMNHEAGAPCLAFVGGRGSGCANVNAALAAQKGRQQRCLLRQQPLGQVVKIINIRVL